jgi:hypothetical protein
MVMSPVGIGIKNHYAGEDQQQFSSRSVFKGWIEFYLTGVSPLNYSDYICITCVNILTTEYIYVSYDPENNSDYFPVQY